ncbi:MAG: acyl--CoA ligase [Clostridia bacterium]|nr:acyl--CoA ligase [Clostridia bacterium]
MQRNKTVWYEHQKKELWKDTYPETSMYAYLKETAAKRGGLMALTLEGKACTFEEMFRGIEACNKAFQAIGVKKGDMVTIISPNLPQAVYAFYALNAMGAVANMLHPALSPAEFRAAVVNTDSHVIVVLDILQSKLSGIDWPQDYPVTQIVMHVSDALSPLKKVLYRCLKEKKTGVGTDWNRFLKNGAPYSFLDAHGTGDDTAVIMYSGGTTGESKGIKLSNRNFNALAIQSYDTMGIDDVSGMKVLDILPVFHGTGLGVCIHSMLCNGIGVFLIPLFNAEKCTKLIFKQKIEFLFGVPAFYDAILRQPEFDELDCSFLQVIGSCGDVLPDKTRKKINAYLQKSGAPCTITNGYGMTECTAGCCYEPYYGKKEGTSGIMVPDMLCKIVEPGTQIEVPVGEVGELCIAGPTLMQGYYRNEEATKKALQVHDDGITWLHSGDAFSVDEEGFLTFRQRLDRMFIVSGFNIYPSEIESVVGTVPGVKQCCVVGEAAAVVGKRIVCFVVADDGADREKIEREIRAAAKGNLAEYAQPSRVVFLGEFPKTKMNKVNYHALEALCEERK